MYEKTILSGALENYFNNIAKRTYQEKQKQIAANHAYPTRLQNKRYYKSFYL